MSSILLKPYGIFFFFFLNTTTPKIIKFIKSLLMASWGEPIFKINTYGSQSLHNITKTSLNNTALFIFKTP